MKIAFDATVLHGRKSGVGYYCEELLKALAASEHAPELFVFSHRPLSAGLPLSNGRVRLSDSKFCRVRAFYLHVLLPRLLRRERPDLCHYTNFLAPLQDVAPYVVTMHDMTLERLASTHPLAKRLYTKRLIPRVAERARLVITDSEYSKWEIVRYLSIPASRIRVTPLAASPEFHPVPETDRAAALQRHELRRPYVLYVGNLEPRKNLQRLLQAFARLRDTDHELAIVGNRWYRGSDVDAEVESLGIRGRVRFLGYVPRQDLPALYSGATVFVYPSLLEGFGLPVVEAMACGSPVITSDNSSLKELAGDAARLVDPLRVESIREALEDALEDASLRSTLSLRGLERARHYSWESTAALTLDAYREALGGSVSPRVRPRKDLCDAVQRSVDYAAVFQYPLRVEELRQRLFDVEVTAEDLDRCCHRLGLRRVGEFIAVDPEFVPLREFREALSDSAIRESWALLRQLSSLPFVRMIAFSGATAHRNMSTAEDVDLFIVVEDGKLWAAFLISMIWAKLLGVRRRLCMNYVISDRALPLFDHDMFTAQQAASLKPIFGKGMYDRLIAANDFIKEYFPNFVSATPREAYPELQASPVKKVLEAVLKCGPIQILERFSRAVLGKYLRRKIVRNATEEGDVLLEPRRLKLHMNSHRRAILTHRVQTGERTGASSK